MSMQDPIADMLTCIRNGHKENKKLVSVPSSRLKIKILDLLKFEGFIKDYHIRCSNNKNIIILILKYFKNKPVIETLIRISRPGLRVYKKHYMLPKIMCDTGINVVSTSKGIITDRVAYRLGLGGEVIFHIS
ncbi:MAG: 30S ribosomal subunit protein S8 [Candidatus Westeberhardia cardiocondylae]|nr:30S ribosomal subunit protein S8 [Candidatus Westeberhardia cardiocondylae]